MKQMTSLRTREWVVMPNDLEVLAVPRRPRVGSKDAVERQVLRMNRPSVR